jgi:hypothetical protein
VHCGAAAGARSGSASGVLNSAQQLGGAVGIAAIGTVFFSVLAQHGFLAAAERSLLVEAGLLVVVLALTPMLPRWVAGDEDRADPRAAPPQVAEPADPPSLATPAARGLERVV